MAGKATGTFAIGNYVKVAAARYGDREAISCMTTGRRLTFRQINQRVNGLANGLLGLGIRKGDNTAFLSYNRHEVVETYFALGKIGSIGLPLNYRLSPQEMVELMTFCDTKNLIFEAAFADLVNDMRPRLPGVKQYIAFGEPVPDFALSYEELIRTSPTTEPDVEIDEADPQYLNLTSGTTGLPKAYMLSQYNNAGAGAILTYMHDVTANDVVMTVFPIFGRVGFAWSACSIFAGARNVIHQFDMMKILGIIEQEKVTISNWVPTMASFILTLPDIEKHQTVTLSLRSNGVNWADVESSLSMGTIITVASGLSLGSAIHGSTAGKWLASILFSPIIGMPLFPRALLLAASICLLKTMFSSNTATAAILMPVLISLVAGQPGQDSTALWQLVAPAAMATSLSTILTTSSPTGLLAYRAGYFTTADMAKAGLLFLVPASVSMATACVLLIRG